MEFRELQQRGLDIRRQYADLELGLHGRSWTREEIALGFVGDVGDLAKLVQALAGIRHIPDAHEKLAHELADCLWCVVTLAHLYDIDLERAFLATMDGIEASIVARRTE